MSDVALQPTSDPDVFTPYNGEPVTKWRQEVADLQRRASRIILEHADPEDALRTAHNAASDLSHMVKQALRSTYGKTFDRFFDNSAPAEIALRPNMTMEARILDALKNSDVNGLTLAEIETIIRGRTISRPNHGRGVYDKVIRLWEDGLIRREGKGYAKNPHLYFLV